MALQDGSAKPVLAESGKITRLDTDMLKSKHAHADISSGTALSGRAICTSYASGTASATGAGNSSIALRKVTVDVDGVGLGPALTQAGAQLSIPLSDGGYMVLTDAAAGFNLRMPTYAQLTAGSTTTYHDAKLLSQPYVCWMFRIRNASGQTATLQTSGGAANLGPDTAVAKTMATATSLGVIVELDNSAGTVTYSVC